MPLLFSYGTLQQEDVQRSTFGRTLSGERDELPQHERAVVVQGELRHANAKFNGDVGSRVAGTVFVVTDEELALADTFEAPFEYERVEVTLESGKRAWAFVFSAT